MRPLVPDVFVLPVEVGEPEEQPLPPPPEVGVLRPAVRLRIGRQDGAGGVPAVRRLAADALRAAVVVGDERRLVGPSLRRVGEAAEPVGRRHERHLAADDLGAGLVEAVAHHARMPVRLLELLRGQSPAV